MSDHEIQLDGCPATAIDLTRRIDDFFVGNKFVDNTAHTLGRGFGRECEATCATVLEFFHEVNGNGFNPQGWQGYFQMCTAEFFPDLCDQFQYICVIG